MSSILFIKSVKLNYGKYMEFYKRFNEAIRTCGMTQKEIAQKLHICEGNITNWKKGDGMPSIKIFVELCKLLDESADYLLGLKDEI